MDQQNHSIIVPSIKPVEALTIPTCGYPCVTNRHHFQFNSDLQELRTSFPGLPTSLQFFDLAECYALCDLLTAVLPPRTKGGHEDAS